MKLARPISRHVKGVIFDMDGTLCLPQTYMFKEMRDALGIDKKTDILVHVHSLEPKEQEIAQAKLQKIERAAMLKMTPQPGLQELMGALQARGLPITICTRNFKEPVQYLISNFLENHVLEPVITREFYPPKPHPDGILEIARQWEINPSDLIMVGDSMDDMHAGFRAGTATVLLRNKHNEADCGNKEITAIIDTLPELLKLIDAAKTA